MKILVKSIFLLALAIDARAQQNPAITSWLLNSNGIMGSHYVQGNSIAIQDNVMANIQQVAYSAQWVYVTTNGIPAYTTGPFLDGNPSLASDQNAIFKFPLNPIQNLGNPVSTTGGNIGVFVNGVALFDYRDGVSWNNNTQAEGGGPIQGPPGQGIWNRDAIVAERQGFDCAKGHPAMGNYHHHQNPSAFDLDLTPISSICNLYDADGLYAIDASAHSPLIGFAYDGFPIYGAFGFLNADGSGGVVRMKSSYQLRDITVRTHYANGNDVTDGPAVSATYPLGHYREDYEFISHVNQPDYLDEHNGRFCVTPEYPNGIYAYFCTVDENWNSAYPYVVGPTFYGPLVASKVSAINEAVTVYNPTTGIESTTDVGFSVYPNPVSDLLAVQLKGLNPSNIVLELYDMQGRLIKSTTLKSGTTIAFMQLEDVYSGQYILRTRDGRWTTQVLVKK